MIGMVQALALAAGTYGTGTTADSDGIIAYTSEAAKFEILHLC